MAIRDWHGGQLVLYWVGLVLIYAAVVGLGGLYIEAVRWTDPAALQVTSYIVLGTVLLILAAILLGFVITWRWFGGRRRPR